MSSVSRPRTSISLTIPAGAGSSPRPLAIPAAPLLNDEDVDHLHDSASIDLRQAQERALFHAWRAGDRDALAELLELHQARIYAVCLGMTGDSDLAQDLAQDALVKVIQGLPGFGFRSRLSTWITRVAINVCLSDRRKRRLRRTISLNAVQTPGKPAGGVGGGADRSGPSLGANLPDSREPAPGQVVQSREECERLRSALIGLEPQQRAILILRDGQGFDYSEIASILEIPEGTVKSRLFRARLALRSELERLGGAPSFGGSD
jgi:RNA polymerase sigma-70 factor (ECF subfamily)